MAPGKHREKVLGASEVQARLKAELPHWALKDGHLCRIYRTHGWKGTLMAINAVGHLAEAAWHHPDLLASYASVEVRLQSHDAGGITEKDFKLATKIEEVVQWQPGRTSGPLTGTPQEPAHAYIKYD
jgi:4a-hydroxytetrahydrobiopterin dehydratase